MTRTVATHSPVRWIRRDRLRPDSVQHVLRKDFETGVSYLFKALCGFELWGPHPSGRNGKVHTGNRLKITVGPTDGVRCCPRCLSIMTKREHRQDKTFRHDRPGTLETYFRPWTHEDGDTCTYSGRDRMCGKPVVTKMVATGLRNFRGYRTEPLCLRHAPGPGDETRQKAPRYELG